MEGEVKNDILQKLKGKVISVIQCDKTLTKEGFGADAKVVGDRLKEIKDGIPKANELEYNNETSGLEANTFQGAIDEIVAKAVKDIQDLANVYLSLNGGELKGPLNVKRYDNGFSTFDKNHSETADYGTFMADTTKDGKTAKVSVCAALGTMTYTDVEGNIRDVHHEGSKPFGSYIGNGSATERTIDTKGIGRLAILYNKDNLSFVTPQGAVSIDTSAGTIDWVTSTKVNFLNGLLTLATTGEAFNIADKEYYYQVI